MTALAAAAIAVTSVAACTAERDPVGIAAIEPAYGPLVGGSRITITGHGFEHAAGGAEVLIDGRAAPLVETVDGDTLEVLTPPGERPGAVDVVVLVGERAARAIDGFHYSTPPAIDSVTPADVLWSATDTRVIVHGSGFADEDAGAPMLLVGGQPVAPVVVDDRTLSFVAPQGRPLHEPDLEVANARGHVTHARAYRYLPSMRPGLLLFTMASEFAIFHESVSGANVVIPHDVATIGRLTAVVRDAHGDYWGMDRGRRLGHLDLSAQRLDAPVFTGRWVPAMSRLGDDVFAVDRGMRRIGRLDVTTGDFTPLGDEPIPCCGSYGLAADGDALYLAARNGDGATLQTVDVTTGALGPAVPLVTPAGDGVHVEDMRFVGGILYASSREGALMVIDPATGRAANVASGIGRIRAMEVFEP